MTQMNKAGQQTITINEIDQIIRERGTVVLATDGYTSQVKIAGLTVRAMGRNFYASAVNVKIGFLDSDGAYTGEHMKLPLESILAPAS